MSCVCGTLSTAPPEVFSVRERKNGETIIKLAMSAPSVVAIVKRCFLEFNWSSDFIRKKIAPAGYAFGLQTRMN
jgi:hypothetical protein